MTEPRPVRPMPPGLRAVFCVVMLLGALSLAAWAADLVTQEVFLTLGRTPGVAQVTAKEVLKGKGGTTRQLAYTLRVNGSSFVRCGLFGLVPVNSTIAAKLFDGLAVGNDLFVVYSRWDPRVSRPADEPADSRLILGLLASSALCGFLGARELRVLLRH